MISSKKITTLNDYFFEAEKMYKTNPFIRYTENGEDHFYTYSDFSKRIRKFAQYVRNYNESVGRRANVALIGRTGYDYLTVMLGTICAGSAIVPLDAQMNAETLADHLQRSDSEILFFDSSLSENVKEALKNCPSVKYSHCIADDDNNLDKLIGDFSDKVYPQDVSPDECAFIIYTSGTTGKSKGVMLSHKNLLSTILTVEPNPELESGSVCAFLPPHHIFSINCDYLYAFRFGMALCLCDDLSHFIDDIKKYQPATIHIVPMMVKALYRKLISEQEAHPEMSHDEVRELVLGRKFSRIISGGGGLPDDLRHGVLDFGLRIASGYGMSECSPTITIAPVDEADNREGTVGKLLSGCRVRITDEGEVQVKGNNVMMGYYNAPEETRKVFTVDGWLKTGDIGRLDSENYLYLTGRKKNLIILSNGENVSPEEIEKHFSDVRAISEIIVFGKNDSLAAEIYPDPKLISEIGKEETENMIREAVSDVNRDMPSFKRISDIIFRSKPFERTASKKIIRSQTYSDIGNVSKTAKAKKVPATELECRIAAIISKATGSKNIGADETFASLGLDSFGCVSTITDIFEKLGYSIDLAELMENDTVEKLAAHLENVEQNVTDYSIREEYPISNLMKYFVYVINGNTVGNVPSAFELSLNTDIERLKKAINTALDIHPILKGTMDMKNVSVRRSDNAENQVDIIETTEAEWGEIKNHLVTPFGYQPDEKLYHICIYKTEKAVYLRIDLSHAASDGVSLGIFIRDVSRAYSGEKLTKEKNTFYEYLIDDEARFKNGAYERDTETLAGIFGDIRIDGSALTLSRGMDLKNIIPETIKQRLYKINREEVMKFCAEHCTSENILFITAFNICVSLFENEKHTFTTSIHNGRTDGKYTESVGVFFRQYPCRYDADHNETVDQCLDTAGKRIRSVMKMYSSCANNSEFLFQFQGDIFAVDKIGDEPCKRVDISIDSHPFRIMIMNNPRSYLLHLSYWANRFDTSSVYVFIDCYQYVLNALMRCRTVSEILKNIPDNICPGRMSFSADEINKAVGCETVTSAKQAAVYILDETDLSEKPFGAWGTLCIADTQPVSYSSKVRNPYTTGILYKTDIKARIMPDYTLDVYGEASRTVRVENQHGGYYYDLHQFETIAMQCSGVVKAHAYLGYVKSYRVYVPMLDVETDGSISTDTIMNYFKDNAPEGICPVHISIISE